MKAEEIAELDTKMKRAARRAALGVGLGVVIAASCVGFMVDGWQSGVAAGVGSGACCVAANFGLILLFVFIARLAADIAKAT